MTSQKRTAVRKQMADHNERVGNQAAADQRARAERDAALLKLAQDFCGVETLLTRGRDSLDFPEVPVNGLKAALLAAYRLGQESAAK